MASRMNHSGLIEISSNATEVDGLLNQMEELLESSCLDTMSAFRLRCAVVEVVNNCIQHAYGSHEGQPIRIAYKEDDSGVEFTVSDRGRAFDDVTSLSESGPIDESGRGLEIIRAWVNVVEYKRQDGWNHCRLAQYNPGAENHVSY